jgi:hypothetical protein
MTETLDDPPVAADSLLVFSSGGFGGPPLYVRQALADPALREAVVRAFTTMAGRMAPGHVCAAVGKLDHAPAEPER